MVGERSDQAARVRIPTPPGRNVLVPCRISQKRGLTAEKILQRVEALLARNILVLSDSRVNNVVSLWRLCVRSGGHMGAPLLP